MMIIRELSGVDFKQFWDLRFRALMESPDAFGATYEEEINKPIDLLEISDGLPLDDNFIIKKK